MYMCVYICSIIQSCLTLCDPTDCSPRGSSVHGLLQARILEWVATSFSRGSSSRTEPKCLMTPALAGRLVTIGGNREVPCIRIWCWEILKVAGEGDDVLSFWQNDEWLNNERLTLRRLWPPTPVFLPGKFHGQRSLTCYSPWGCRESDRTKPTGHLSIHHASMIVLTLLQKSSC